MTDLLCSVLTSSSFQAGVSSLVGHVKENVNWVDF